MKTPMILLFICATAAVNCETSLPKQQLAQMLAVKLTPEYESRQIVQHVLNATIMNDRTLSLLERARQYTNSTLTNMSSLSYIDSTTASLVKSLFLNHPRSLRNQWQWDKK